MIIWKKPKSRCCLPPTKDVNTQKPSTTFSTFTPQSHVHKHTLPVAWPCYCVYSFSTWSNKTKVVHSGNGAARSTICSAGRPLCCHLHAWTAVNDRHTTWRLSQSTNPCRPTCQKLLAAVLITLYSLNCLPASFMNTACVPRVQLPESIWMYWTPTYESNHKVYIQEQGCYGHHRGAVKITLVIWSPGSKQSGNIWG